MKSQTLPGWIKDSAVVLTYALLTVGMTWPLTVQLNTHFAGQNIDVWINQWATWWTERALREGLDLYYTHLMFYPDGVSLAFHSFSHVNSALAVLLRPWVGDLTAHNLTMMLAHILSGYAVFCLARHLTRSTLAAFLAGLVFAFYPYRMAETVHPVLVSTQWIPFYILYFMRLIEEEKPIYIAPITGFFLLTALTSWHLMILTCIMTVLYLLTLLITERARYTQKTLHNLFWLMGVLALTIAPFIYPLIREQLNTPATYVGVEMRNGQGNDLLALVIPQEQHPLARPYVVPLHARMKNVRAAYMGMTVLALSGIAAVKTWKRARFWIVLLLASVLLSSYAHPQIGGYSFSAITLPWTAPVIWLLRHPYRFNLLIGLALAILSGMGASQLLDTCATQSRRGALAGALMGLVLFEYLYWPFPNTLAAAPDYYQEIAAQTGTGALLELPMGRDPAHYYLYYQMIHQRPLVEGIVSRTPYVAYTHIRTTPILRSLFARGEHGLPPANLTPYLRDLAQQNIEYIILHKQLVEPRVRDLHAQFASEAQPFVYEDNEIAVYNTSVQNTSSPGAAHLLEACIAVQTSITTPLHAVPGTTLDIPLEWIIGNTPTQEYIFELALRNAAGTIIRQHYYGIVPGATITDWAMGKQYAATYPFTVDDLVPPGTYTIQVTLVPRAREPETLLHTDLFTLEVTGEELSHAPTQHFSHSAQANYGDVIRLLDYTVETGTTLLHLSTRWEAQQTIAIDYKIFVHLYSTTDQSIVAQADMMPQAWTYPTSLWQPGRIITDDLFIPLENVPAGSYYLGMGIYDPNTGTRLDIRSANSLPITPDHRLILLENLVH